MEASQHSLLATCFTLHSINATLAIVPQRGAGLWLTYSVKQEFMLIKAVMSISGAEIFKGEGDHIFEVLSQCDRGATLFIMSVASGSIKCAC
jgi:hypothetical protein